MSNEEAKWIESTEDATAVIVVTLHQWGRGRTIEEAVQNLPSYTPRSEVAIVVCFMPKGCKYESTNKHGVLNEFYVNAMGDVCYPRNATIVWVNHSPIKISKIEKFDPEKLD